MPGPPVRDQVPWVVRVERAIVSGNNLTMVPSTGTAVPPWPGERHIRWVFIAGHTWERAGRDLTNIFIFPTEFVGGVNRPTGNPIGINHVIEGGRHIAAVHLETPIEIPPGVNVPFLNFIEAPTRGNVTIQYGFGGEQGGEVLEYTGGEVMVVGELVVQEIDIGAGTEGGDSGSAVLINGRIAGIHTGTPVEQPDPEGRLVTLWTPLFGEEAMLQAMENYPEELAATPDPDAPGGSGISVGFSTFSFARQ
jgi:hypothetical protein